VKGRGAGPNDRGRTEADRRPIPGAREASAIVKNDGRTDVRAAEVEREDRCC
jgi:hypothetical protein